jgi:hypothetical protein
MQRVAHTVDAMTAPRATPRRLYEAWIEEQLEDYKSTLGRDELLELADEAVAQLFDAPGGQYPLTEILLCDAVDALLLRRLNLPDYRQWLRTQRGEPAARRREGAAGTSAAVG